MKYILAFPRYVVRLVWTYIWTTIQLWLLIIGTAYAAIGAVKLTHWADAQPQTHDLLATGAHLAGNLFGLWRTLNGV